ncbi:MAG: hypothetical protein QM630_05620 [Microbacterium sp.]
MAMEGNGGPEHRDSGMSTGLEEVLESAARLQRLVPDAVLVGGSAAAYYARHRMSTDHDPILEDLSDRFDVILDALERVGDFVLNRAVPGKIILGELGGIEAGIRQMIRTRPLDVQRVRLPSGAELTVPTLAEIARVKGYLIVTRIVKRNQLRDYVDVAALSGRFGAGTIGPILAQIDDYYTDPSHAADRPVRSQRARQLALLEPRDRTRIADLPASKGLVPRWQNWDDVIAECRTLAALTI